MEADAATVSLSESTELCKFQARFQICCSQIKINCSDLSEVFSPNRKPKVMPLDPAELLCPDPTVQLLFTRKFIPEMT